VQELWPDRAEEVGRLPGVLAWRYMLDRHEGQDITLDRHRLSRPSTSGPVRSMQEQLIDMFRGMFGG
jgi:hypothetical protein